MHLREDFCEPPALKYFYGSGTSRKYSDISLIFSHVFVRKKQGVTLGKAYILIKKVISQLSH